MLGGTPGFSGADLANLINESALLAARKNKRVVTMSDIEEAKDKVMMGAERRSMVMSEDEKKLPHLFFLLFLQTCSVVL